jgi:DNA-binding Lrp family transcriptional regulator
MNESLKLDRIDINILAQLQRDSQLTNLALADAVNLSPSPCLTRVKRLEKAGYIGGYRARLNLGKIVDHIIVFTEVTLHDHLITDLVRFETEIRKFKELQECHMVSGGYDYLLKFVTRNVMQYQQLMESILQRNIGIVKYFSYIVIKTVMTNEEVPLKSLLEGD